MKMFSPVTIGSQELRNRIIRSATFEGMADSNGFLTTNYEQMYRELSQQEIGAIITGFAYISQEGKAMQFGQAGIDSPDKIEGFKKITDIVHKNNGKIFKQIAHTGRQTKRKYTGEKVVGVSRKMSPYFLSCPRVLSTKEIDKLVDKFAQSAKYTQDAGFDGVQLHCAHGYLIHQFLHPTINTRKDCYGINKKWGLGTLFLEKIIDRTRELCGKEYPILVKVSGSDDFYRPFKESHFISLIKFLEYMKVDAVEVSYGTMDYALSIFRGSLPLHAVFSQNPIYKTESMLLKTIYHLTLVPFMKSKLKPFSPTYNLPYAELAKKYTGIPVIAVGGFRSGDEMEQAVTDEKTDMVSLCRPFLAEVDFIEKIKDNMSYRSTCVNCNLCAINCDTIRVTKCIWRSET